MKKKVISIIGIILIVMIISITTTYAANYLYNSEEVYYENKDSKLKSSDVQGAIDELYTSATDYSSINTRVTTLEKKVGDATLITTSNNLSDAVNGLKDNINTINDTLTTNSIKTKTIECNNIVVATASTSGAYYSTSGCSTGLSTANKIISVNIIDWSGVKVNFTPYISSTTSINFVSSSSQKLGTVWLLVAYI